ncbi:MAG: hypothetical protein PHE73_03780 [Sulfurovaceae bacterium]|nr:hypothetical protein [Sulfurovaceae bacterium]
MNKIFLIILFSVFSHALVSVTESDFHTCPTGKELIFLSQSVVVHADISSTNSGFQTPDTPFYFLNSAGSDSRVIYIYNTPYYTSPYWYNDRTIKNYQCQLKTCPTGTKWDYQSQTCKDYNPCTASQHLENNGSCSQICPTSMKIGRWNSSTDYQCLPNNDISPADCLNIPGSAYSSPTQDLLSMGGLTDLLLGPGCYDLNNVNNQFLDGIMQLTGAGATIMQLLPFGKLNKFKEAFELLGLPFKPKEEVESLALDWYKENIYDPAVESNNLEHLAGKDLDVIDMDIVPNPNGGPDIVQPHVNIKPDDGNNIIDINVNPSLRTNENYPNTNDLTEITPESLQTKVMLDIKPYFDVPTSTLSQINSRTTVNLPVTTNASGTTFVSVPATSTLIGSHTIGDTTALTHTITMPNSNISIETTTYVSNGQVSSQSSKISYPYTTTNGASTFTGSYTNSNPGTTGQTSYSTSTPTSTNNTTGSTTTNPSTTQNPVTDPNTNIDTLTPQLNDLLNYTPVYTPQIADAVNKESAYMDDTLNYLNSFKDNIDNLSAQFNNMLNQLQGLPPIQEKTGTCVVVATWHGWSQSYDYCDWFLPYKALVSTFLSLTGAFIVARFAVRNLNR